MSPTRSILAISLLLAIAALAQPGDKPRIEIPEPTRQSSSSSANSVTAANPLTITAVKYQIARKNRDSFPQAIPELVAFFRRETQVEAPINHNELHLDSERILNSALLYMTGNDAVFQISKKEMENLGRYLKSGGLLYAEDIRQSGADSGLSGQEAGVAGTPFDRQFKALMRDPLVLDSQGKNWEKIPSTHPLYSSFYPFPDGPPLGGAPGGNVFDLEMLQLRGRPAVIFSDLNISWYWGDPMADSRDRGLQFGCNLIVYAMTQRAMKGSIPTDGRR